MARSVSNPPGSQYLGAQGGNFRCNGGGVRERAWDLTRPGENEFIRTVEPLRALDLQGFRVGSNRCRCHPAQRFGSAPNPRFQGSSTVQRFECGGARERGDGGLRPYRPRFARSSPWLSSERHDRDAAGAVQQPPIPQAPKVEGASSAFAVFDVDDTLDPRLREQGVVLIDQGSISHIAPSSSESRSRTYAGTELVELNTVVAARMG